MDIGLDKNGFLHVDDIVMPGVEVQRRGRGGGGKGQKIAQLLKPGQEILVQVVKDPLKTKGARLTMELSIAGRYLVYVPNGEGVGVSRRLEDKERDRLRKAAKNLDIGEGGAIVRTAAHGATREDLEREIRYLHKLHEILERRTEEATAPSMVFQEADLSVRVVRDIFSAQFERAVVDDEDQHHRLVSFFTRTAPELVDRVELHSEEESLLERFGVEAAVASTLNRRVDLPSGGYLIIDYAEALTVIDVNSGSFTGRGRGARLEDTITKTNLEAADEVVRQLRLRDIGGIIVIDFIDMARARNRDQVLKVLRNALDEDRTKTYVVEISPLGLVEMTRQNVTEGVREILTKTCPTCEGEGVVLSEETVALDVERRLRELVADRPEARGLPDPGAPGGGHHAARRTRDPAADRARAGARPPLPLRGVGVAADRPLRGHAGGSSRRGRGARAAVPGRARGARDDRGAAHVQRGRRRGQDRRLHRLGHRSGTADRRQAPGAHRAHRARPPRTPRSSTRTARRREGRPTRRTRTARRGAGAAAAGAAGARTPTRWRRERTRAARAEGLASSADGLLGFAAAAAQPLSAHARSGRAGRSAS